MKDDADETRPGLPIEYRSGDPLASDGPGSSHGRTPKASETLAERIIVDIVSNGYRVGDRLPAESDMLQDVGGSRETLRGALQILEAQGILDIRRGPGGGPFVNALNAGYLARTSALYFHLAGATYDELFESWASIEPLMAAKVASLPDRRWKLTRLSPFLDYDPLQHSRGEMITDLTDFHAVVATMGGNRVLTLLTQSVNHIVVHQVLQRVDPTEHGTTMAHSHHEIARALVDGHATKARRLTEAHIREVIGWSREARPELMDELIEWR
ncbi:FadR/GntR family transcriptional regulator [Aeromicrobium sp. Sec7.5]|uniref:FadR/GntR family transcriptional regulator n=1 Tax=Aeromicrobium sp. Sec7.5 TaxID=3121276 RepID=UPI002FE48900